MARACSVTRLHEEVGNHPLCEKKYGQCQWVTCATRVKGTGGISPRHSILVWYSKSEHYRTAKSERDVRTFHGQRNEIPACFRRFLRVP